MKHIFFIILLGFGINTMAQVDCPDEDPACNCGTVGNGITTNPDNPINGDCSNKVNTFDWRIEDYPIPNYASPNPATTIKSPFHEDTNPDWMRFVWDDSDYYAPDYHPEDGWEMIKYDLDKNDFLYLVLYNKFSGILRILTAIDDKQDDYESLVATIDYSTSSVTGLFAPERGRGQYMDEKSISLVSSTVAFNNSAFLFHIFDFPVEYDPCTCFFDNGTINISFDLVKNQSLTAYGRLIATQNTLANIQDNIGTPLDENFLTAVYSEEIADDKEYEQRAGTMVFKDWDNLNQFYEANKLAKAELEDQLTKFQNVKTVLDAFINTADDVPLVKDTKFFKGVKVLSEVNDLLSAPIKKKISATQGKLEAAGSVVLTQAELSISGNLETAIPIGNSITFSTPGRLGNSPRCNAAYPLYDEVLGRFTILEEPSIDFIRYVDFSSTYPRPREVDTKFKLKFNENTELLYKINPALGVVEEYTKVYASVVLKTSNNKNIQTDNLVNLSLASSDNDLATYVSPMMPIECLSSLTMERNVLGQYAISDYDLSLRVLIFYEFEQDDRDGNNNKAFQVITYPLKKNVVPYNTISTTPHYENEVTLISQNYTSNQTIFALEKVTIDGNLTTSPGIQITIIAPEIELLNGASIGTGITLVNGESPGLCNVNNLIKEANHAELETFCKGSTYKANDPVHAKRFPVENDDNSEDSEHFINVFSANPNPVGEFVTVSLDLEENLDNVSLSIRDVTGQIVTEILEGNTLDKGSFTKEINVSDLPSGVYFISLASNYFNKTLKIIKL